MLVNPTTLPCNLLTACGRVWSSQTMPMTVTDGSCLLTDQLPVLPSNPAPGPATAPQAASVQLRWEHTSLCLGLPITAISPEGHWLPTETVALPSGSGMSTAVCQVYPYLHSQPIAEQIWRTSIHSTEAKSKARQRHAKIGQYLGMPLATFTLKSFKITGNCSDSPC